MASTDYHTKNAAFSDKMMALLRARAEQQPLPRGYMRCPFDPQHQIPIAAVVTHLREVHGGDALALVDDAMYSEATAVRRVEYISDELHSCYGSGSGIASSSFTQDESDTCTESSEHKSKFKRPRFVSRGSSPVQWERVSERADTNVPMQLQNPLPVPTLAVPMGMYPQSTTPFAPGYTTAPYQAYPPLGAPPPISAHSQSMMPMRDEMNFHPLAVQTQNAPYWGATASYNAWGGPSECAPPPPPPPPSPLGAPCYPMFHCPQAAGGSPQATFHEEAHFARLAQRSPILPEAAPQTPSVPPRSEDQALSRYVVLQRDHMCDGYHSNANDSDEEREMKQACSFLEECGADVEDAVICGPRVVVLLTSLSAKVTFLRKRVQPEADIQAFRLDTAAWEVIAERCWLRNFSGSERRRKPSGRKASLGRSTGRRLFDASAATFLYYWHLCAIGAPCGFPSRCIYVRKRPMSRPESFDEVTTEDLAALLAELRDVGGVIPDEKKHTRLYPSREKGQAEGTSTLSNQLDSAGRVLQTFAGGSGTSVAGQSNSISQRGISGSTTFSTYAALPDEVGKSTQRRTSFPLGVRLAPIRSEGVGAGDTMTPGDHPATFGAPPALPTALSALPPLPGGPDTLVLPSSPPLIQKRKPEVFPNTQQSPAEVVCGTRETNFLPIMCARYLRPAGITPRARWGHSLTAMHGTALLMFGGMEVSGDDSATLFEFDTSAIAWDPVFVAKGTPPAPRYAHAACAYDGRWLIVGGGTAKGGSRMYGDLHRYDMATREWTCLWSSLAGGSPNKNEPSPRLGHTMVIRDDRLYLYGGKVAKQVCNTDGVVENATTTVATGDVYVFSLNSMKWKKRIRVGRTGIRRASVAAGDTHCASVGNGGNEEEETDVQKRVTPPHRFYHASCLQGDKMYISGGCGQDGNVLSDTWSIDLTTGVAACVHPGGSADAFPRERHDIFVCGEALLVVGGCAPSMFIERVTDKFHNFVSVLPLFEQVTPCWVPVAMGNVAIVAPNKKSFGAAFSGGFVYVFGGMCGYEPATNSMVRFLAADGYVSADARATTASNDTALRSTMQHLRENCSVPYDVFAVAGAIGGEGGTRVGMHRALVQQRAPLFWQDLQTCRRDEATPLLSHGAGEVSPAKRPSITTTTMPDEVDILLHQQSGSAVASTPAGGPCNAVTTSHSTAAPGNVIVYFTEGNSRVKGLSHSLTAEQLACLLDYLYWGGLRAEFRALMEDDDEQLPEGKPSAESEPSLAGAQRDRLTRTLQQLKAAASTYKLGPLFDLCDALLDGSRRKALKARAASTAMLRSDLVQLLHSSQGATTTVLFVDPHTQQQTAHALHPVILMAASTLFADLLRPLLAGEKTSFHTGSIAAKVQVSGPLVGATSKRAILIGPVSVPQPAVQHILRFLYTQTLHAPPELAFQVMIGAHQLGLSLLQAYCEAIVAREEVNYDSCCSFYYLSRKYDAALLEEIALITAVAGYSTVRHSPGYASLADNDKRSIDVVAQELGSSTWVPPPQPTNEMKPAAYYAARWNASAASV